MAVLMFENDIYKREGGTAYTIGQDEVPFFWNEYEAKQAAIKRADGSRNSVPIFKNVRTLVGWAKPQAAIIVEDIERALEKGELGKL